MARPGQGRAVGRLRGKQEIFEYFGRIAQKSDRCEQRLHAVVADDEHAVALINTKAARGGEEIEYDAVMVLPRLRRQAPRDVVRADGPLDRRAVLAVARRSLGSSRLVSTRTALVVHAKMLRQELLEVKGDLERGLGKLVLDCSGCGQRIHYVSGLGGAVGRWAHREPAPHHSPVV